MSKRLAVFSSLRFFLAFFLPPLSTTTNAALIAQYDEWQLLLDDNNKQSIKTTSIQDKDIAFALTLSSNCDINAALITINSSWKSKNTQTLRYKKDHFQLRIDRFPIWDVKYAKLETTSRRMLVTIPLLNQSRAFVNELKKGTRLRLRVGEQYTSYSLKGSAKAIKALSKECATKNNNYL